ncbi:MAG: outer membrane beta-barrel protein [Xanthomonadales bacterium]|nr:outer membrane beta-barrel protein [Xanthomonadales bacterium]
MGPFRILATLGLTYGYDDNIARTQDTELDSHFTIVSPGIRAELPTDRSILSLTWDANYARYEETSLNDYDDWVLKADWRWDPTSRTSFGLFAQTGDSHVERGEGTRQGEDALLNLPLDEYEAYTYGGSWTYGAVGSRGRLTIDYAMSDLSYQNNPEFTEVQDRQTEAIGGTFFLRIRPKTSLLVGVQYIETDYDLDSFIENPTVSTLDSDMEYLFVGVSWDISARTSGRIDFGWHERNFDAPDREGYDSNFWRAGITWAPRTYSTFDLNVSRDTSETVGFGDYVLRDKISLSWNHAWNSKFSTAVQYGIGTDDPRPSPRKEDYTTWGISARWQLGRHFQLAAGWQHYERDVNQGGFDYEKNIYLITLEASY